MALIVDTDISGDGLQAFGSWAIPNTVIVTVHNHGRLVRSLDEVSDHLHGVGWYCFGFFDAGRDGGVDVWTSPIYINFAYQLWMQPFTWINDVHDRVRWHLSPGTTAHLEVQT